MNQTRPTQSRVSSSKHKPAVNLRIMVKHDFLETQNLPDSNELGYCGVP